ncbi:MAG: AAA family ATPase [Nanoarchaeota archaeon]|nr:AAA family ATPase [Nanoarchaeota archaeon]
MIIKNIKLENIRSYISQDIELPQGSVLLSGDIGSGKSTVLLAIDFALFGLRKTELTGASLLRNGTNEGSVEMHFEIDGQDVIIKRNLKRTSSGISQDAGFIMINGEKRDGTAIELKQSILNLLNYPKDLLTKSKSLIYKYTVYTPQEEMKHILIEDKDARLDTLRKVFGINKYKRIRENTGILTSAIKEKKKELAGQIHDLEQKKGELKQKKEALEEENSKLETTMPRLELLKRECEKKKKEIEETENQITKLNKIKNQLEIKKLEQKTKEKQNREAQNELEDLSKQVTRTEKEIKEVAEESIDAQIKAKREELQKLEKETRDILNEIASLRTKKIGAEELKARITDLENCPTCKQEVKEEHKTAIREEEDNKLTAINKKLAIKEQSYEEKQQSQTKTEEELEQLKEKKSAIDVNRLKLQSLEEKKNRKEHLKTQQGIIKDELEELKDAILNLEEESKKYKDAEGIFKTKKQGLEKLQDKKSDADKEAALIKNEIKNLNRLIAGLNTEVSQKEKTKQGLAQLIQLQEWTEKHFLNLMEVMEKNIMLKVHNDFDSLFQKWFNMLIETGMLQAKMDPTFTPLIEQNGHDIDYAFLSGGEKTAVALAYRLALNQVINKLMRNIKTSDLLILDEPTDGFSNEQLDRVKDVIEDLDLKQIILVSHEPKVESFVNNTIMFKKENHVSQTA